MLTVAIDGRTARTPVVAISERRVLSGVNASRRQQRQFDIVGVSPAEYRTIVSHHKGVTMGGIRLSCGARRRLHRVVTAPTFIEFKTPL